MKLALILAGGLLAGAIVQGSLPDKPAALPHSLRRSECERCPKQAVMLHPVHGALCGDCELKARRSR